MSKGKLSKGGKRLYTGWRYKGDAGQPANGLGSPLRVFANTIIVFIVSQVIAAFVIELGIALFFRGKGQDVFSQSVAAQFLFVLVAEGLALWLTLQLVKRRGVGLGFIGLGRRPKSDDIVKAAIGYAIFLAVSFLLTLLMNSLLSGVNIDQNQNLGFSQLHGAGDGLLAFIALVILPPLGEEPLVRGYLYSGLRKHWRVISSVLATSIFFGLAHLEIGNGGPLVWGAAIDTFFLSVILCFLREKTGALYAGILVHMLNNVLAFAAHFYH